MCRLSNYYSDLLKLCSETQNRALAKKLHCCIIRTLPDPETFLFNKLIDTYAKLRNLRYARHLFDDMPYRNLFSWNTILCAYSKSGCLSEMQEIFRRIPGRDGVSWNVLISGYSSFGSVSDCVKAYALMLRDGSVKLNRITFSTMLALASSKNSVQLGVQVHGQVLKFGFELYTFVASSLLDMYSKAGFVHEAKRVFDKAMEKNVVMYNAMLAGLLRSGLIDDSERLFHTMRDKDSISWTTMVTGLSQNGLFREAIDMFREMRSRGLSIDQFTFGSVLTACSGVVALEEGKQIHAFIIQTHHKDNVFVGSALVDMYCKCRAIKSAELVFNRMKTKNVVSWTALVVGYGQNGHSEEAIRIFSDMLRNGVEPDDFTLGSVVSSCANLASLDEGAQCHARAVVSGLISFVRLANAIVTLYGKCGSIGEAHKFFDEMKMKDGISWTALVSGYAQFGKANETIELFERMLLEGFKPDGVTFIGVLSACSRTGLVEKGRRYFDSMVREHGIEPVSDHYTCMIDLLSRAGRLEEAKEFITKMPLKPDSIAFVTLLSSCRNHRNMEIGKWAAESLLAVDPHCPASYLLLSSLYASDRRWNDVAKIRRVMRDKGVRKEPGCSWIKHKGRVYIFSANDNLSSPFKDQIYSKLEELHEKMIEEGYVPDMSYVLHDVAESEKRKMLKYHSERLAIAFGLIFVPDGRPIHIVKNLRVCGDCHDATKFIARITKREILVRDAVRFHLFKAGMCSCGDFW